MADLQTARDIRRIAMILKKEKKTEVKMRESAVKLPSPPTKIRHPVFQ
jgi:hypothetical protein